MIQPRLETSPGSCKEALICKLSSTGGARVAQWWRGGGAVVARWWRGGGAVVVE